MPLHKPEPARPVNTTVETQTDSSRPLSATPSKLSISGTRDFGMKFMPGVEDMPVSTTGSQRSPDTNTEATWTNSPVNAPPTYWEAPHSEASTELDDKDEDEHHPYLLSWWWILKGTGLILFGVFANALVLADAIAKLLHHTPVLYGDTTVRKWPRVTGVVDGCAVGGKYLGLGIYDGLADWVVLPCKGAKEEGAFGAFKGFLRAPGSTIFKMAAGIAGIVGHPFFGIYKDSKKIRITIKHKRTKHRKDTSQV
ncbi:hypothetical protein JX266_009163 [Neoarthrinium moseri]|nr:hypothetical protein JX266_009163 [Neoarthrinium moseri]